MSDLKSDARAIVETVGRMVDQMPEVEAVLAGRIEEGMEQGEVWYARCGRCNEIVAMTQQEEYAVGPVACWTCSRFTDRWEHHRLHSCS